MIVYLLTGAVLVVYLVLVWFIGTWLQLRSSDLWILRGALWLIGLVAAGIFLWFHHKKKSAVADATPVPEGQPGSSDIDLLVHEASRRLKSSTLGRGATLGKLPLIFLLGESGSTKTSTVLHSDLEAELLAGQVFQDNNVLPTRVANIWYTREALFIDTAGDLVRQQDRWKRLIRLVQPSRMSSAIGNRQQAPRAAIVCFDCANFLQPGATEATLSAARNLGARLHEISQTLSISFPVYVLFTKLDRISFFTEFVRGFSRDEASEVLGATLPVRSLATGAYSEEETQRLTKIFDDLFFSLAEKRTDLLGRENEVDKLAGIYEFPRELRKLRSLLVQFLVDLARPSQLTVNPFLRGFYFSGVRPVIVEDGVQAAPKVVEVAEPEVDAGATRIFGGGAAQLQRSPVPARVAGSRKVPQWVFLSRLFNEVIVKDRVALAASGFSSRVSLLRRLALGFVTAIGMVCAIAFVISFVGNRALESSVRTAVEQLRTGGQPAANQLPSLSDLQDLDRLRQELLVLSTYQREGAPWHLRWGLYFGDRIYPDARRVYFGRFRQLLLSNIQARLVNSFRSLPLKPGANDPYDKTYDELKAYLITTSHHEKSTQAFLSPVLTSRWAAGKNVDTGYLTLVKSQFDFYSAELALANPFSSDNDAVAVEHARAYLGQFGGVDRYYRPIVDEASRKFPAVSFNEQFTNSAGVFVSDRRVPGAFTKSAFSFVQDAIRSPSRYISAEDWVLGKATATELDQGALQQKLTQRYYHDYINEWRALLMTSHVVKFGLPEAYDRLDKLTSPISPLLELLWLVSYNTDVGVSEIVNVFAPVAAIEKPAPRDQLIQGFVNPDNTPYVTALAKVGVDVDAYQRTPDPNLSTQALHSAGSADLAARAVTSVHVDIANHTEEAVRKLLEEPIVYVEDGLTKTPVDALNAAGQGFCQKFEAVRRYYPFSPSSPADLPVEQLNAIFVPGTGALWSFYNDAKLGTYLSREGSRYVPNPSAPTTVKITPEFLDFFNRMVAFSDAFYLQGSTTPQFAYTLKELQSEGLSLKVGAETLSAAGQQKTFKWTGSGEEIQIITTIGAVPLQTYPGSWAFFKFVSDSHTASWAPSTDLEWILQVKGKNVTAEGKNKSFNYELQVSGANPFRASELSSLRCVATVAKQGQ